MKRTLVTTCLASLLASLAACGGGGSADCKAIYDIQKKCQKTFEMPRGAFMSACSSAAADSDTKEEVASMAKCARAKDCAGYEACQDAARGARRAKDVEKLLADGKIKEAFDACTLSPEYFADASFKAACLKVMAEATTKLTGEDRKKGLDRCRYMPDLDKIAEVKAVCTTFAKDELGRLTEAMTKARDASKNDFALCAELEDMAKTAGGDEKAAEVLCKEAQVSESVHEGAAAARANAAAKKAEYPYQCTTSVDDLNGLGTEWSKAALADLMKACFVELGVVVFEAKAGEAQYTCPYEIEQALEASTKYGLAGTYPELAAAIKKLPKLCQPK